MKLKEFIETYLGFDWDHGEVVVIDQRKGNSYLCDCKDEKLIHTYHDMSDLMDKDVYNWTHSAKTMLITL